MAQYLKGDSPESKSFNVLLKRILFPGIVHRSLAVLSSVLLLSESVTATPKQFSTHSEGGWGGGSSLAQQPGATEIEANRAAAERAYEEGVQLYQQGTAESLQQAITKFVEVLPVLRAEGKKAGEAYILSFIGYIYSNLGEKQKALEFYNQSLSMSQAIVDKRGEARTFYKIGEVYIDLGEKQKALSFFNQALPLSQVTGDKAIEAAALSYIGIVYFDLGEKQKALSFFNQALPLSQVTGNKIGEARTLNNIGEIYSDLGEKQKALSFFNQALPLSRVTGDKAIEATILYNLACLERDRGNLKVALTQMEAAIKIFEDLDTNIASQERRDSYFASLQSYSNRQDG